MHIRINEVSREPDTGLFYIDVDFWLTKIGFLAGHPPILSNDFRMQLFDSAVMINTDAAGFLLTTDGNAIDPTTLVPTVDSVTQKVIEPPQYLWKTSIVPLDMKEQIRTNIVNFVRRAENNSALRGDLRDRRIKRSLSDGSGRLAQILTLAGTDEDAS